MTRVIFYTGVQDSYQFLFRFLQKKIFEANIQSLIFGDKNVIDHLDNDLWRQGFLPHDCIEDYACTDSPILLSSITPPPTFFVPVLISWQQAKLPSFFSRFPTYVDIVGTGQDQIIEGRQRYVHLKDHGYSIDVHKMS